MKRGDKVRVIATQETGVVLRVLRVGGPWDRLEPVRVDVDHDQGDLFDYIDGEKPCLEAPSHRYTAEELEVL